MTPSFEINKAAHQAASRTAHEFPDAGAQLPEVHVHHWGKCPHCHQPLPTIDENRVIYCQGRPYKLKDAPKYYEEKGTGYALDRRRGCYVCIG